MPPTARPCYASGPASEPEKLGQHVADMLIARGADALLP
jgi:hydroxymethylbilane synthase